MRLEKFFLNHPVFTTQEWMGADIEISDVKKTRENLLSYYAKTGRLQRVRRELYAVVPEGFDRENWISDAYLIAAKLAGDAVLAYRTALDYYGKSYSVYQHFYCLTEKKVKPFEFQGNYFKPVQPTTALVEKKKEQFGIKNVDRSGMRIRVTDFERTMVDVLDRPQYCGSWEEIWRSLEMVEYFNVDRIVEYVLLLENATTVAKVGFYLEQHREQLMVEERQLNELSANRPLKPHYMIRSKRKGGTFLARWNLVVPNDIINKRWQEIL